jgi:hypothetical protein
MDFSGFRVPHDVLVSTSLVGVFPSEKTETTRCCRLYGGASDVAGLAGAGVIVFFTFNAISASASWWRSRDNSTSLVLVFTLSFFRLRLVGRCASDSRLERENPNQTDW